MDLWANGQLPKEVKDSAVGEQRPIWLPDGRLAWQTPDRQNYRIRDLLTGRDEYLFKGASDFSWVDPRFSPRGDQLVLGSDGYRAGLLLLSWPSREERFLASNVRPIGWSADGEWIYAIQPVGRALVRVSQRTGSTETIGQFPAGLDVITCDLTPDRDAIICSLIQRKSDAWVMANFDPDVR